MPKFIRSASPGVLRNGHSNADRSPLTPCWHSRRALTCDCRVHPADVSLKSPVQTGPFPLRSLCLTHRVPAVECRGLWECGLRAWDRLIVRQGGRLGGSARSLSSRATDPASSSCAPGPAATLRFLCITFCISGRICSLELSRGSHLLGTALRVRGGLGAPAGKAGRGLLALPPRLALERQGRRRRGNRVSMAPTIP